MNSSPSGEGTFIIIIIIISIISITITIMLKVIKKHHLNQEPEDWAIYLHLFIRYYSATTGLMQIVDLSF